MSGHTVPENGHRRKPLRPEYGRRSSARLRYHFDMPENGHKKVDPLTDELKAVLASNLARLMQHAADRGRFELSTALGLQKVANLKRTQKGGKGLGKTTVGAAIKASQAATLATLANLAELYEVEAWMLLYPGFEPQKPPVVLADDELRILSRLIPGGNDAVRGSRPGPPAAPDPDGKGPGRRGPPPPRKPPKH